MTTTTKQLQPVSGESPEARAAALRARAVLTVDEGVALRVLNALLGIERGLPRTGVNIARVRPRLAEVARERLAIGATRFLLDEGGRWERTVLRGGRRATGRLWDGDLNAGFDLAFTSASLKLWLEAARTLPALGTRPLDQAGREETARAEKRLARDVVEVEGTRVGDWVFYAMVHKRLGELGLPDAPRRALARRLRAGSPFALLMGPDEDGEITAKRLRPLVAPDAVRVLECADAALVRAWAEWADDTWDDRSRRAAVVTERWRAFGRMLRAYVSAVDDARRVDLVRPVVRLLVHLATRTFAKGGAEVRRLASSWYDLRDIRERDELLASIAAVVGIGGELFRRREELASQRYGDERYEEAQLFLRVLNDELARGDETRSLLGDAGRSTSRRAEDDRDSAASRRAEERRRALEDVARGLSGTVG